MKAIVDKSGCIACGLCVTNCPEVFRIGSDGLAEAYTDVTSNLEASAIEAREGCPVSVITIED